MARVQVVAGLVAALAWAAGAAHAQTGPIPVPLDPNVPVVAVTTPLVPGVPGGPALRGQVLLPPPAVAPVVIAPPPARPSLAPPIVVGGFVSVPGLRMWGSPSPIVYSNPAARFQRPVRRAAAQNAQSGPGPMREVTARGAAAIRDGDQPSARAAAVQQALRQALEQVVGVYVAGSTVADRFIALRDRVYTHSEGFVVPGQVLEEGAAQGVYTVRMKAFVSLRPLVAKLRELGLTRQWRVAVALREGVQGTVIGAAAVAQAALTARLQQAGFSVVTAPAGADADAVLQALRANGTPLADVLISGTSAAWLSARLPATCGDRVLSVSPLYQARVDAHAVRVETGEIVGTHVVDELIADINDSLAARGAVEEAVDRAAGAFLDDIMVLPAAYTRRVRLEVRGFRTRSQAQQFQDCLAGLPDIRSAAEQDYADGVLSMDLEIAAQGAGRIGTEIELAPELKQFRVTVDGETKARIRARVSP